MKTSSSLSHNEIIYRLARKISTHRGFLFAVPEVTFYYNIFKSFGDFRVKEKGTVQRRIDLVGVFVRHSIMDVESWDVIGYEIKKDHADFNRDHKMIDYYRLVNKLYLVCPRDVVKKEELPSDRMGLIYFSSKDAENYYRCVRLAKNVDRDTNKILDKKSAVSLSALRHINRGGAWPLFQFPNQPYSGDRSGIDYGLELKNQREYEERYQLEFDMDYSREVTDDEMRINRWDYVGKHKNKEDVEYKKPEEKEEEKDSSRKRFFSSKKSFSRGKFSTSSRSFSRARESDE